MDALTAINQYTDNKNTCLNSSAISIDDNNNNTNKDCNLLNSICTSISSSSSISSESCNSINAISENYLNLSFNEFMSKTNLIVNYLPQTFTQEQVKQLFSTIGPVESCKLVKHKISDQSLGYAFVNLQKPEDATKAIKDLNGMRLQKKTIKVSYARPSSDTIKGANLYICGLRLDITQRELENMFLPYGTIISSKILTEQKSGAAKGAAKGVGFVRFDQRSEAEIAIQKLNGSIPEGSTEPITVKFSTNPAISKTTPNFPSVLPFVPIARGVCQPYRTAPNTSYRYSPISTYITPYLPICREFIQPYRTTSNLTYRYSPINPYCSPDTATIQLHETIPTPLTSQTSINLANVLTQPMPATATLQTAPPPPLQTSNLNNTNLNTAISAAVYSGINPIGYVLYVYNLAPDIDENKLWQLFGPFGAVQSVKIARDVQTQKCKGFAFVTMTNYYEAAVAISYLNGYTIDYRMLQVCFKKNINKLF